MTLAHLRPTFDAQLTGDAVATSKYGWDHDGFRTAVEATARRLGALGVGRGDVVAVVLPNRVELVITLYATWLLGAALTPVIPPLRRRGVLPAR